eukprot:contig_18107_g4433
MAFDLDTSQQTAWEAFLSGKNAGLFGRAGSGKSVVLRRAIQHAQRVHGADRVGVLSWTTHAAKLLDGETLHKFLQVGIAPLPKDVILASVRSKFRVKERIKNVTVIFIDELPQVPTRWFVVLEYVERQLAAAHKQALPWGGCQVVGTSAYLAGFSKSARLASTWI